MTPIALSWSGGKDCALALERLRARPIYDVVSLLTTVSSAFDRVSIHGVRRTLLHRQAASLGLPLVEVTLGPSTTNERYEAAFAAGLAALQARHPRLSTMAFGDLFLEDVRAYRERLLGRLGWTGVYPIWGEPTAELALRFVATGHRAVLTCVDTTQLDAAFVGREYDASLLADLPASVDPCGERGEFHSVVYAGPLFTAPIAIRCGERALRDGRFQYCDVLEA